jgi:hypothetical protein
MSVTISVVKTHRDLKQFIHLPAKIHIGQPNWVPPIYSDDWIFFDSNKNRSFGYCDTILLLAFKEGVLVGRIMGIINHRYNDLKNEKTGRFDFLECFDDPDVANTLLKAIEDWAKEKGMNKMIGPFGFSDKDPQGLLIEGFDQLPAISTNYNMPYMIGLIENNNYRKELDLVSYKVKIPDIKLDLYEKLYQRLVNKGDYYLKEFTSRKEIKKYIRPVFTLINESYADIYGFMPFEQPEMDDFANRFLMLVNPAFVKVVIHKDQVVAFFLAMPDISVGLQKSKGYIYPVGFIHIFKYQKKTKRLVLLLGAVKEGYRGLGLDAMMGLKMIESARNAGLEYWDSHLTMENNLKFRAENEKLNGELYKRYRIYQKPL